MKRFKFHAFYSQFTLLPTIGYVNLYKMNTWGTYRHRIYIFWLFWAVSFKFKKKPWDKLADYLKDTSKPHEAVSNRYGSPETQSNLFFS